MIHRVMRTRLSSWADPAAVFQAVAANEPWSVWLDGGPHAVSGVSYLGIPRSRVVRDCVETGLVTFSEFHDGILQDVAVVEATIFDVIRDDLAMHSVDGDDSTGFSLGWIGWFGYELAAQTTGVHTEESRTPDAVLVFLDRVIEFDHATKTLSLVYLVDAHATREDDPELLSWRETIEAVVHTASAVGAVPVVPATSVAPERVAWRHAPTRYEELVQECLTSIRAGDAYQLCLTNEVRISVTPGDGAFDPFQTYLRLRAENPSHHGALLRFGETSLLSSSPEIFLSVSSEGRVVTKPIKGTRRRGETADLDSALVEELVCSEKERAENLMIVDLMRNDLGRIAQLGTVNVDSLLSVETYENVHQLVSTVSATLAPGLGAMDALHACFPAGSMTGAPKISAMNLLAELEQGSRGIYSGAFGYLGLDGAAELAMVIRSIVLDPSGASIGTGGGITSGSIAHEELQETWVKVTPLLRALGVSTLDYS